MSFFNEFIDGVASDVISAVTDRWTTGAAKSAIYACCRELGLSIHSRTSDGGVRLHFHDPLIDTRVVMVGITDRGANVSFMAISPVTVPAKNLSAQVMGYLLERNAQPFVAWQVAVGEDGTAMFILSYRVPTPGVHPQSFKLLCQTMATESLAFDSIMQRAGLLQ